jgi:signal peptidase I
MENEKEVDVGKGNQIKKNIAARALPFIWEFVKIAIMASVIVLPIRYFLFQPFIVKGESMAPNFSTGDYLIVDEITYRFSEPQRGDVIIFKYPKDNSQRFIKRIIGLPGETVQVRNGQVLVYEDDKEIVLDEKYLPKDLKTDGDVKTLLNNDEYFVMGDNREQSFDSRVWGIVPRSDIIGKAFLRIFPISSLSQITPPSYGK